MGKLITVNAFLGIFTKIQTTQFSELYAILGQITASLNSIALFSLDSSECVALILFQNVGRREMRTHMLFPPSKDHIMRGEGPGFLSLPHPLYYTIKDTSQHSDDNDVEYT